MKRGNHNEEGMHKNGREILILLIVVGLLATAGLVIIRFGVGLLAIILSISGLATLLLLFTRRPRPEGELPSASVSCCHYLGEHEDEHK
jgi:hypothetical protein